MEQNHEDDENVLRRKKFIIDDEGKVFILEVQNFQIFYSIDLGTMRN